MKHTISRPRRANENAAANIGLRPDQRGMIVPQRPIMLSTLVFSSCLFIAACNEVRPHQISSLTPVQMREDLIFLRDTWAPMDKSFSEEELQVFGLVIEDALENVDALSPAEFALEVARAAAVSGNGHTSANPYRYLNFLPIRVWWFSDGLYIVEAEPGQEHLLGLRVERIGNVSAEEALSMVAPFLSGTKEFIRYASTGHLVSLESLYHAGIIPSIDKVELSLTSREGGSKVVTLSKQKSSHRETVGLKVPIPSLEEEQNRWSHVLDNRSEISPAFRPPDVDVSYEWLAGNTVLYIRSDAIFSYDKRSLHDKFINLLYQAKSEGSMQYVILDLRLNGGGDFFNSIVFSQMLPHMVPEDGRIFVLIGHGTFSAAIVTAAMLKGNGGNKVLFVGERMGDNPQFWSEGRPIFLPNSKISVTPAHSFHDWSNGCADLPECYLPTVVYAPKGISLEPDIPALLSFEDYASGHDGVLEAALLLTHASE